MANLKIAPQPANVNSTSAAGLKGGLKGPHSNHAVDAQDFEAKLKEGLKDQAEKKESKKIIAPAIPVTPQAQAADLAKMAKLAEEEKAQIIGEEEGSKKQGGALLSSGLNENSELAQNLALSGQAIPATLKMAVAAGPETAAPADANAKSAANEQVQNTPLTKAEKLQNRAEAEIANVLNKAMNTGATTKLDLTQLQGLQGQAVSATEASEFESDFEIEHLDVKSGEPNRFSDVLTIAQEPNPKHAPVSKLSTTDYLNLRDLAKKDPTSLQPKAEVNLASGLGTKKGKLELLNGRDALSVAGGLSQPLQLNPTQSKMMEATVTQGAAGNTVLSHDSVNNLTQTVNMMSIAKQDGEIKIRLRPDHLGELQMSVKTLGNQVAIQIKAQDGEAKRIIEESLGSLKDSFAKQNLNLAQIDVVTAPTHTQTQDQGMQMDFAGSRQNFGQESRGFDQGQNSRQDRLYEDAFNSSNLNPAGPARSNRYANANQSGLDLIA